MLTSLMLAPLPNMTIVVASGQSYQSDSYGVIHNILTYADQTSLVSAGCAILTPPPTDLLFYLRGANFNSTADQLLTPTFTGKFRPKRFVITNASVSLTTAAGGFYSAASKGGTTLVAAGQAYSALTTALLALEATLNSASTVFTSGTPLYLSLTTGQGSAATADVFVYGDTY